MIYDSLKHLTQYQGLSPAISQGLELLLHTDFSSLPDGRHEVDGSHLYFSLQSYETKQTNDTPESHRKYIDIQFLIEGQEKIGIAPLEAMTEEIESNPQGDIWFYHGPMDYITLSGDRFVIFFPGDAHAPCIADGVPSHCRKCVVKVHVEA